ncbi:hypothetical protein K501DRAFT_286622 [Backusella circina FSU 941]|nr:hypothetical protein K501DRAFT_286622 [Backusella circina FSU 941]
MKNLYPENKFDDKWIGPMTVEKQLRNGMYMLNEPNKRRLGGGVNGDMLVTYHSRNLLERDDPIRIGEEEYEQWKKRKEARGQENMSFSGGK